jgi:hypothetical protein
MVKAHQRLASAHRCRLASAHRCRLASAQRCPRRPAWSARPCAPQRDDVPNGDSRVQGPVPSRPVPLRLRLRHGLRLCARHRRIGLRRRSPGSAAQSRCRCGRQCSPVLVQMWRTCGGFAVAQATARPKAAARQAASEPLLTMSDELLQVRYTHCSGRTLPRRSACAQPHTPARARRHNRARAHAPGHARSHARTAATHAQRLRTSVRMRRVCAWPWLDSGAGGREAHTYASRTRCRRGKAATKPLPYNRLMLPQPALPARTL